MSVTQSLLGDLDEALVTGSQALAIAGRLGDLRLQLVSTTYLAQAHHYRGDYQRSVELALDNVAALPEEWLYDGLGNASPLSIYDRLWLISGLGELGRFTEAAKYEREILQIAETAQHAYIVGQAHMSSTRLHLIRGDWTRARALIENGIAAYRAKDITLSFAAMVTMSAMILAYLGEIGQAQERFLEGKELIAQDVARGALMQRGRCYWNLGRVALLLGRPSEARILTEESVTCLGSQAGFAAHSHYLLGDVLTHPDLFDAPNAEQQYREGLALAEPRGMRPLVANCHLGLGALYRRTGRHDRGREHLTTAIAMFRELEMRYWLEQAEAESQNFA
jgi:tetratricopeptide (TPR) repeat protein